MTITKIDSAGGSSVTGAVGTVVQGQALTYTIVVSNTGTQAGTITGATVDDPFPTFFTATLFSTSTTGGAQITTANHTPTGINDTVTLPAGSTITYTVTGMVSGTATGTLINPASIADTPPNGTPTSTTATDTDNVMTITKIDSAGGSSVTGAVGTVVQGQALTYTIVVSNTGTQAGRSLAYRGRSVPDVLYRLALLHQHDRGPRSPPPTTRPPASTTQSPCLLAARSPIRSRAR